MDAGDNKTHSNTTHCGTALKRSYPVIYSQLAEPPQKKRFTKEILGHHEKDGCIFTWCLKSRKVEIQIHFQNFNVLQWVFDKLLSKNCAIMPKIQNTRQEIIGEIKPKQTRPDYWQVVRCVHLPLTQRYCFLNTLQQCVTLHNNHEPVKREPAKRDNWWLAKQGFKTG